MPEQTVFNHELALKVLDHIRRNRSRWYQGAWAVKRQVRKGQKPECGTAMCFAGWTVILSHEDEVEPNEFFSWVERKAYQTFPSEITHYAEWIKHDGEIKAEANRLLGENIVYDDDDTEVSDLFAPRNSFADLGKIIRRLKKQSDRRNALSR